MTTFSTQLKKFRQERHLSQDELAKDLFISRQAISKWENAEATPDLEHTVKLAEILQVSLDELILAKEPEVKIERVIEKDRPMNIWEFFCQLLVGCFSSWRSFGVVFVTAALHFWLNWL